MDLLINFEEKEYNSRISTLRNSIVYMKEVIEIFNSIPTLANFEKEDFKGLFLDTENFLFEKLMKGKPTELAGMSINKRKFFDDYLEKPKGYYDVIKQMELFNKRTKMTLEHSWPEENIKSYLNFFSLLPNGDFEIQQQIVDKVKRQYETYITTEKAKHAYKIALAMKDLLNENNFLRSIGVVNQHLFEQFIRALVPCETDKIRINDSYISQLDFQK